MDSEAKFTEWMSEKFQQLGIDDGIFGNYILDILKVDDSNEGKIESLDEIFSELVQNSHEISLEFVDKFNEIGSSNCPKTCPSRSDTIDKQLLDLLDQQKVQLINEKNKNITDEIRELKNSILSMYVDVEDDCEKCDSDGNNEDDDNVVNNGFKIEENRNVMNVRLKEQEMRQQSKLEAQKKKDKDKEDREKQKKLRDEKKEKRKTQKNERKR